MNYKTHTAGSLLTGIYVSQHFLHISDPTTTCVFIAGAVVGGVLPDIDKANSYLGNRAKPVSMVVEGVFGHRRLFHAPILYIPLYFYVKSLLPNPFWMILLTGILMGVFSHLALDTIAGGIPWLYPYKKRYKIPFIKVKTDSFFETIVFIGLLVLNVYVIGNLFHIINS